MLAFPVAFAIDDHARSVGIPALQDAIEQELQLVEGLAVFADESARFDRGDVQQRRSIHGGRLDFGLEAEAIEHRLQGGAGIGWRTGGNGGSGRGWCFSFHAYAPVFWAFGLPYAGKPRFFQGEATTPVDAKL